MSTTVEAYKELCHTEGTQEVAVDGGRLVIMLYDLAIDSLHKAKEHLAANDYMRKGIHIGNAQDVVAALSEGVNTAADPEVRDNLIRLYNFVYRELIRANIELCPEKIDRCINVLTNLREGWQTALEDGV